jgi:hypothetical protein
MKTCPICGAEAEELPPTGDFHGTRCPTHDEFEVSDTAMSIRRGKEEPKPLGEGVRARQAPSRERETTTNHG